MKPPPGRVAAFIDGFNMYHALHSEARWHRYKWLNYRRLCFCVLPTSASLDQLHYFTALYHNPKTDGHQRHQAYIRALLSVGADVIYGKFKHRDRFCPHCKREYPSREEKETDVNIAIGLYRGAARDEFDTALLVTADTDLLPAIKAFKADFPGKQLGVIFPPGRASVDLKHVADFYMKTKEHHLSSCQFENRLTLPDGTELSRPGTWS